MTKLWHDYWCVDGIFGRHLWLHALVTIGGAATCAVGGTAAAAIGLGGWLR